MDNPRRILVIQLKRAGDVILTTPILQVLGERFPEARIDFLVYGAFAPLLEDNPWLHAIQIYDPDHIGKTLRRLRSERYDWVIDFQSSPRSAIAAFATGASATAGYDVPVWGRVYNIRVPRPRGSQRVVEGKCSLLVPFLGRVEAIPGPRVFLSREERAWAGELLARESPGGIAGLVPTHRRLSRRWEAASFAALARQLHEQGFGLWLFWGPGEREYVEQIQRMAPTARLIPAASLRQMAALLAGCQFVITNDNGPMHLAVAVGTPTVTIYGPTDPLCWNPGGPFHIAVQAEGLSCLGCNLNVCPFGHECMTQVTPERVYGACEGLLSRSPAKVGP